MLERAVMTGLETGCHAPLGVSAWESDHNGFRISLCFSRTVQTEPVRFADPVFLRRQPVDVSALVREVKAPFRHFFWWGFKDAPAAPEITGIRAIEQIQLTLPAETNQNFISVFAASEATFPYLEKNQQLTKLNLFAAGSDTAAALKNKFPGAEITVAGRGFAAALNSMPGPALWLGSVSGEARARSAATGRTDIEYRAVYENEPVAAEKILALHAALKTPRLAQEDIHLVTSAAAAQSFVNVFDGRRNEAGFIACFGRSAADILAKHGFTPCHVSDAGTFAEFWAEMRGDTALMRNEVAHGK
jgi:uroporphyrinogen-III synthase